MSEVKSPPKIKIQVAIKFPKKLQFRRILMDLAAEAQDVITAFDEIRLLVSRLLAAQLIDAKNGDSES